VTHFRRLLQQPWLGAYAGALAIWLATIAFTEGQGGGAVITAGLSFAERKVEVVDGDDEHLRDRGEGDRQSEVEQEVQPDITHRPRLQPEDGGEDQHERQDGQDEPGVPGQEFERHGQAAVSKEDCSTRSSVISPWPSSAMMRPLRKT